MATTDKKAPKAPAKSAAAKAKATRATSTPKPKAPSKASATTKSAEKTKAPSATKPAAKTRAKAVALAAPEARAIPLREEASQMVRKIKSSAKTAAATGKAKTSETLDDVSAMVEDVARTLDQRVGPKYGAYARRAADALSGASDTLKAKDVDALLDDVRDFVRRKPAVAIGAAAALGFVLTRLLKADQDEDDA